MSANVLICLLMSREMPWANMTWWLVPSCKWGWVWTKDWQIGIVDRLCLYSWSTATVLCETLYLVHVDAPACFWRFSSLCWTFYLVNNRYMSYTESWCKCDMVKINCFRYVFLWIFLSSKFYTESIIVRNLFFHENNGK